MDKNFLRIETKEDAISAFAQYIKENANFKEVVAKLTQVSIDELHEVVLFAAMEANIINLHTVLQKIRDKYKNASQAIITNMLIYVTVLAIYEDSDPEKFDIVSARNSATRYLAEMIGIQVPTVKDCTLRRINVKTTAEYDDMLEEAICKKNITNLKDALLAKVDTEKNFNTKRDDKKLIDLILPDNGKHRIDNVAERVFR